MLGTAVWFPRFGYKELRNDIGWTALIMAVSLGDLDAVRYLIEQGVDVKDKSGYTVLIRASSDGHLDVVQ